MPLDYRQRQRVALWPNPYVLNRFRVPLGSALGTPPPGQSYYDLIMGESGLVAYWRLGESQLNIVHDAKGVAHGFGANGYTVGIPDGIAIETGTGGAFDGTAGTRVEIPHTSALNLGNGPLSVEMWVKRGTTGGGEQLLISKGSLSPFISFGAITADRIAFGSGFTAVIVESTVAVTDTTTWHHIVCTKSGAASKIYLDGVDVTGTVTDSTLSSTSAPVYLGADVDTGARYNGSMDDVAEYNVALTLTQVRSHYVNGLALWAGLLSDAEPTDQIATA